MAGDAGFHPGTYGVAVAFCADQFQAEPMITEALVVAQEQRRATDLRQHDVQVAIAIYVSERRATANDRFEKIGAAFGCGYGFETDALFVAAIPE